jgi:hypothetical protein
MNAADCWSAAPTGRLKPAPTYKGPPSSKRSLQQRRGRPDAALRNLSVDYFAQIRRCRRINEAQSERFAVVGVYHSHPRGDSEPSETDVEQAFRDFIFLIVGLGGSIGGMEIRAYGFHDDRLMPVPLIVVD